MAKTKISEWSSTPGSNTDIDGINLAEGMVPSDVNNALREMMSQLKNQQAGLDGDSFTVDGSLILNGATSGATTFQTVDAATATITLPGATGTLATLAGSETLTNKALNGSLGATTPSTVVATTVTATGLISGATNYTGFKNLLIDAGFTINQRGYVSAATLASGSYGHDRWKAGASGGDYTFTQLASSTTITIASGKSLIQVVEDKNVNGTSFVLSWTGTAQARYAVNSATPSGSYAASPILITGQTVGTTMSVEFNTGTLTNPQLEKGSTATSFDYRPYGTELALCQRYFYNLVAAAVSAASTTNVEFYYQHPVPMRAAPSSQVIGTMRVEDPSVTSYTQSSGASTISQASPLGMKLGFANFTGLTSARPYYVASLATNVTASPPTSVCQISSEL